MGILPFWIIALIYPCYLLFRNQKARNKVSRARKVLLNCDVSKADADLFRCTPGELEEIGRLSSREQLLQYVGERSENELRWQVIEKRFIMEEKSDGQTQSI